MYEWFYETAVLRQMLVVLVLCGIALLGLSVHCCVRRCKEPSADIEK
jgi:hypothetical protein